MSSNKIAFICLALIFAVIFVEQGAAQWFGGYGVGGYGYPYGYGYGYGYEYPVGYEYPGYAAAVIGKRSAGFNAHNRQ